MKQTYESFEELAEAMTEGDGLLHAFNCPLDSLSVVRDPFYENPCMAWQKGVKDFAGWLDHIGVKVEITDSAEDFYDYMRRKEAAQTEGTG